MSFSESLLISLFNFAVVVAILVCMYVLMELFSKALARRRGPESTESNESSPAKIAQPAETGPAAPAVDVSAGELRLKNVDEKTAAMIMAIVSHESDIPLSQLCFKSIQLIEEES